MSGTTPNVGVRVFSDLSPTTAVISARQSYGALCMPVPGAPLDMPLDEPFLVDLSKPEEIARFPAGTLARDALNQIASEGIVTDIIFVQVAANADPEAQISLVAGSAGANTGVHALASSKTHVGLEPSFILAPGFTALRPDDVANPAVAAIDVVCDQIIDCMGIVDTPETSRTAAIEYAADFAASYNIIACYPSVIWNNGTANVTRPMSPHVLAAHLRRDAEVGNPFKAAWNRPMKGVLGLSQDVTYRDGDTTHDANVLNQGGVVTAIERNLLWGPYTTATDPTTIGYRSIKRIRTRRAVEKALLRAVRKFAAADLGPHTVTLVYRSVADFCAELVSLSALIDYELIWDRSINTNALLRDGGLRVKLRFEETPDLTDLQIYSEPQPEAFDILAGRIGQALAALGNPNIRVAS